MNLLKDIKVLKYAINLQKRHNSRLVGQLYLNPSRSLCHRESLKLQQLIGLRQLSTGAVLHQQDVVKIENEDYNVYITNSPAKDAAMTEGLSIPDPPPLPLDSSGGSADLLLAGAEPTLKSLGLGGWWPSGIAQHFLDLIHSSTGLPWWATICLATAILRCFLFPLVVKSQKNSILFRNHMPKISALQQAVTEAKIVGDKLQVMRKSGRLGKYMKEHNIDIKRQFLPALVQGPIFISFFFGLRKMANTPVPSFSTEGLLWFPNLTLIDPYYLLPVITCGTLYLTIKLGADFSTAGGKYHNLMQKVFKAVPVILFPFCMNFPTAVLCYWVSNNTISLCQVLILRNSAIRNYLNFPQPSKPDPSEALESKKGFVQEIKEIYQKARQSSGHPDMSKGTAVQFKRSGMGPIPKTYSFDPTKQAHRTYSTITMYGFHNLK